MKPARSRAGEVVGTTATSGTVAAQHHRCLVAVDVEGRRGHQRRHDGRGADRRHVAGCSRRAVRGCRPAPRWCRWRRGGSPPRWAGRTRPAAPGRGSRAMMSVPPPGAKPTSMVTAREGRRAAPGPGVARRAGASRRLRRGSMRSFPVLCCLSAATRGLPPAPVGEGWAEGGGAGSSGAGGGCRRALARKALDAFLEVVAGEAHRHQVVAVHLPRGLPQAAHRLLRRAQRQRRMAGEWSPPAPRRGPAMRRGRAALPTRGRWRCASSASISRAVIDQLDDAGGPDQRRRGARSSP